MKTKDAFNRANPNTLADLFRKADIGQILSCQIPQVVRNATPVANANVDLAYDVIALPIDAKASRVSRAYARQTLGAGTIGELAPASNGAYPIDAQVGVAPNGDLIVLAASQYDNVDASYVPECGTVVELTNVQVVSNQMTLPEYCTNEVVLLAEVVAVAGSHIGPKAIAWPGTAVAAGQAALDAAKNLVNFNATDAITSANVKLVIAAKVNLTDVLESEDETI